MKTNFILFGTILITFLSCKENVQETKTQKKVKNVESVANWDGCMVSAYVFQG